MGIKERRTKILLLLFLLSENFFTEQNQNSSPVKLDEKAQKIFDITLNQKTKGTISALLKEEIIAKADLPQAEGHNSVYQLTPKGFYALALEFPFVRFLRDQWDGKWRILSYEIPEKKRDLRDKLRREVAGWGLGPWHRSFWITPHPIIENLRQLVLGKEEEGYIQAFEADHTFGDRATLIQKVWGIEELEHKYRDLFKKWHVILSQEEDKIEKLKKVVRDYAVLLRQDPGLPKELMGTSWIGVEALNIFKEIKGILLS